MSLTRASSTRHPLMQATVEALSEFDAEQAAAVRGVLGLHTKEYRSLARSQGLPEDMPKRTLMRLWVKKLLVDEVRWQYDAFCQVRASLWCQCHKSQMRPASRVHMPLAWLPARRGRGARMRAFLSEWPGSPFAGSDGECHCSVHECKELYICIATVQSIMWH